MIRRDSEGKQRSFGDEARAMEAVPADHILLKMAGAIDWMAVEKELEGYYDRWVGRPSWPPALLLRMLLLQQYAKLSDRQVGEQTGYNLLYRRFVGLGADEAVPDDTTLVRFRERVGQEGIQRVFETINARWAAAGLIGEQRRVLDGVHLWANVAQRSLAALLRQGRQVLLGALERVDETAAAALRQQYPPDAPAAGGSKEEVVAAEC